jgi:hypothetical protein
LPHCSELAAHSADRGVLKLTGASINSMLS